MIKLENFKIGDFIYFSTSGKNEIKLFTNVGMILNINEENVAILNSFYTNSIYNLTIDNIKPLSDKESIINDINSYYDNEIEKCNSQIRSVNRKDYAEEIANKYLLLKQEILNTCKNILDCKDDEEFESKLKAICIKKKNLFSIKCEEIDEARKYNGGIKYKIRELEKNRNNILNGLEKGLEDLKRKLNI